MPRALAATPRKMLPPPMTMRDLDAQVVDLGDVLRDARRDRGVDAERLLAHQRFAGEFEEDATVGEARRKGSPYVPRL